MKLMKYSAPNERYRKGQEEPMLDIREDMETGNFM